MRKHSLPIGLIFLVFVAIFATNFSPHTWLTGWDNLHPEFNFALNFKRALFAVWQEYQGLGLLGGMGHASDLPRLLLLGIMSLVAPANLLRQGYFFLMLLVGPLGVYFLLEGAILRGKKLASTLGGVFYLLNLATVQAFYTPFEPFATHYGFLPWLLLLAMRLLEKITLGRLLAFSLVSLLAVPQAYVPTVFVVYLLALVAVTWGGGVKNVLKILAVTFVVNAYWLLPFLYFTATNTAVVLEAKINQMATENALLQSKQLGSLWDVAVLRGYWFEINNYGQYILAPWREFWQSPVVWVVGLSMFGLVLVGIFAAIKTKNLYRWGLLGIFLLSFTILANATPIFGQVDDLLYRLPLVAQVFRFPFTKFSILLALGYSLFLALDLGWLGERWDKLGKVVAGLVMVSLVYLSWPVFQGSLFYQKGRLNIPSEYFQALDFFKSQDPNTRIADFPQMSYWGWNLYSWGNSGSGFLWYGIEQPILDRAFDVWSQKNENYYWEISYALYSKNLPLFERVLEKYQVNWLLVDGNIINPSSPKALFLDELEEMVGQSEKISLTKEFNKIKIYSVALATPVKDFVYIANNLPEVGPTYKWNNLDQAYFDLGDYTTGSDYTYPFRSLFTGRQQKDLEFDPTKISTGQPVEIVPEPGEREFSLPNLPHDQGYLITAEAKNIFGKPFLFWIENLNSRRADLGTYLPAGRQVYQSYFIQPPMERDGLGYTLHFDNTEVGGQKSVNELGGIMVKPIDFWGLVRGQVLGSGGQETSYVTNFLVEHSNPAFYRVDLGNLSKDSTIVLSQSFEPGWIAIGVDSNQQVRRIEKHELVNNWANGWKLSGDERIVYLFFWPQLLEFAGFGLLGLFVITLLTKYFQERIIGFGKRFPSGE